MLCSCLDRERRYFHVWYSCLERKRFFFVLYSCLERHSSRTPAWLERLLQNIVVGFPRCLGTSERRKPWKPFTFLAFGTAFAFSLGTTLASGTLVIPCPAARLTAAPTGRSHFLLYLPPVVLRSAALTKNGMSGTYHYRNNNVFGVLARVKRERDRLSGSLCFCLAKGGLKTEDSVMPTRFPEEASNRLILHCDPHSRAVRRFAYLF